MPTQAHTKFSFCILIAPGWLMRDSCLLARCPIGTYAMAAVYSYHRYAHTPGYGRTGTYVYTAVRPLRLGLGWLRKAWY
eukprot:SAG31_NODE_6508_length_1992_cov_1.617010_2_plen_79_part_00